MVHSKTRINIETAPLNLKFSDESYSKHVTKLSCDQNTKK